MFGVKGTVSKRVFVFLALVWRENTEQRGRISYSCHVGSERLQKLTLRKHFNIMTVMVTVYVCLLGDINQNNKEMSLLCAKI